MDDERLFFDAKKNMSKKFAILCFSKKWDNPLLWRHYADRHKGFLESEIERVNSKIANNPGKEELEEDADLIKRMIEQTYDTDCRLGKMTFEDKRVIVEKAFGGIKDVDGKRLGVYIKTGSNGKLQYEINGGIVKCIDEDLSKSFLELPMPHYALHDLLNIETDYVGKDYAPFVQDEVTLPRREI